MLSNNGLNHPWEVPLLVPWLQRNELARVKALALQLHETAANFVNVVIDGSNMMGLISLAGF